MNQQKCLAYIDNISYQRDFIKDNTLMLKLAMQFFEVAISESINAQKSINLVVEKQVNNFHAYASTVLLKEAYDVYKYATENGFPFNHYEALLVYNIAYNENCVLSYYTDDYRYTGGAHGITKRRSLTFDLCSGKIKPLNSFFDNRHYKQLILDCITAQADANIATNSGIYFENYPQLIKENFNEKSFYLNENGIVIYFQQYEIAPYSTGIVEFTVPYSSVAFPPSC